MGIRPLYDLILLRHIGSEKDSRYIFFSPIALGWQTYCFLYLPRNSRMVRSFSLR
jgi:hypothetical protein